MASKIKEAIVNLETKFAERAAQGVNRIRVYFESYDFKWGCWDVWEMLIIKDDGLDVWNCLIASGFECPGDRELDEIYWGDIDKVFTNGRGSLIGTFKDVTDSVDEIVERYFCKWPECNKNRKLTIRYETI